VLPTLITLLRVALAFVTVSLFGRGFTPAAIAVRPHDPSSSGWMRWTAGWARRTGHDERHGGAALDITGDRIVENRPSGSTSPPQAP
jgi:hypothetical protein